MFREGKVPPEVAAEYKKMEGEKDMEKARESRFAGSKEELIGNLQAGLMSSENFVTEVLAREGGDPKRAEMAAHSIKEFWVRQLDEGTLAPEKFESAIYDAAVKMLKVKELSQKEKEREEIRKERIKSALGKRVA